MPRLSGSLALSMFTSSLLLGCEALKPSSRPASGRRDRRRARVDADSGLLAHSKEVDAVTRRSEGRGRLCGAFGMVCQWKTRKRRIRIEHGCRRGRGAAESTSAELHRRHRRVRRRARCARALLRQPARATPGMAFVVVQHLSPDFKSLMDELLARHTELPIHLVEDGMPVEADHVYLIPPKKEMIISGGRLLLSEQDRQQELHAADRRLLPLAGAGLRRRARSRSCSRAAAATARAASATSTRRAGWCSCRTSRARSSTACRARARDAGVADLRAARPRRCRERCSSTPRGRAAPTDASRHGRGGRAARPGRRLPHARRRSSASTSRTTSRARSRAASSGGSRSRARTTSTSTCERLRAERERARRALPRPADRRDALLPRRGGLRAARAAGPARAAAARARATTPLRVWVAGCATGEEAYSLAILLQELMAQLGERPVKIFATDVHRGSLERAARALYDEEAVAERLAGAARALLHPRRQHATRSCPSCGRWSCSRSTT